MSAILLLLAGAVLVNDFLLTRLLGLPAFAGAADELRTLARLLLPLAAGLAGAAFLAFLLRRALPQPLIFLHIPAGMAGAALVLLPLPALLRARLPGLRDALPVLLPLWLGNAAVAGATAAISSAATPGAALLGSLALAAGLALAQLLFFAARQRLARADVPAAFHGLPIALCTLGMLTLALLGFASLRA